MVEGGGGWWRVVEEEEAKWMMRERETRESERGGRRSHDLRPSGGLWRRTRSPRGEIPPQRMQQSSSLPPSLPPPSLLLHVFNCHFISVPVDLIQSKQNGAVSSCESADSDPSEQ